MTPTASKIIDTGKGKNMILVKPNFEVLTPIDSKKIIRHIETAGRVCYKSENKITEHSGFNFVNKIIAKGHESVLEHFSISVRVICDRGVSHEIVRHRIASYSQESTRYCNYKGGVCFVIPPWVNIDPGEYNHLVNENYAEAIWFFQCRSAEEGYLKLLQEGWSPQQARSVLPNSLKTEIVMTMNLREWRHFFKLRCARAAHPQMREIAILMLARFAMDLPAVFEDLLNSTMEESLICKQLRNT